MDPEEPLPSDCCGSGCSPCVFDIYQQCLQRNRTGEKQSTHFIRTDLLSETRFKPFILLSKIRITDDVYEFRFQPIEKIALNSEDEAVISGVLPYKVGQFLFLRCCTTERGEECDRTSNKNSITSINTNKNEKEHIVIRAYTPITTATEEKNCCFTIFVKLYSNGTASKYLSSSLVGDTLYWRGPYGSFQYSPKSYGYMLMLCVGSGLAPMISVINSILNNESDETVIHLKCGFKNMSHVILRNELKRMTHFWNFSLEYYFSEEIELHNNVQFGEQIKHKRIDKYSLEEYVINKPIKEIFVLICGTECFNSEMKTITLDLNFDVNRNVHIF